MTLALPGPERAQTASTVQLRYHKVPRDLENVFVVSAVTKIRYKRKPAITNLSRETVNISVGPCRSLNELLAASSEDPRRVCQLSQR